MMKPTITHTEPSSIMYSNTNSIKSILRKMELVCEKPHILLVRENQFGIMNGELFPDFDGDYCVLSADSNKIFHVHARYFKNPHNMRLAVIDYVERLKLYDDSHSIPS